MQLSSNLSGVIGRVTRLRDRDIPAAMTRSLSPTRWLEPARKTALQTLLAIALPTEREFVDGFIGTLTAGVFQTGFFLSLKSPFKDDAMLQDYRSAYEALSPQDLNESLFLQKVQDFERMVIEWVETEKRKTAKDLGKTDEDIGMFISRLMLSPNLTPKEIEARDRLLPHIIDFIRRRQQMNRLPEATVSAWLLAVLTAWRSMVSALWPDIFHEELRSARTELALR